LAYFKAGIRRDEHDLIADVRLLVVARCARPSCSPRIAALAITSLPDAAEAASLK
jgi:hypothetical protein